MANKIDKVILDLLGKIEDDFKENKFQSLWPSDSDSSWPQGRQRHKQKTNYVHPEHRIEILTENFAPIPASRRHGGQYRIFYVYPKKIRPDRRPRKDCQDLFEVQPYDEKSPRTINDKAIRDVLAECLAIRATNLSSQQRESRAFFLSGERGVGKTAFLNNLFSTNHHIFDKHKVVWIRLDLTGPDALKLRLIKFLKSHAHDILVERYLDGGELPIKKDYFDDSDYKFAFDAHTQRKSDLSLDKFRSWLSQSDRTNSIGRKIDIDEYSSQEFDPWEEGADHDEKAKRFELYSEFLRSQGYSFIYVIDGLDESTVPLIKYNALRKWADEVKNIAVGKRCPKGMYIICARHESYPDLLTHIGGDAVPHHNVPAWIVAPVHVYDVIDMRVKLFNERVKREGKRKHVQYWKPGSAEYVIKLTLYAIERAFKDIGMTPELLQSFSKLGHMRALMRFVQDATWETVAILDETYGEAKVTHWFPEIAQLNRQKPQLNSLVKKQLRSSAYRIWYVASLNYADHYKKSVEFITSDGRMAPPSRRAEFPLIPLPWGDMILNNPGGYYNNHLLIKIRILQILEAQTGSKAQVEHITHLLHVRYHYMKTNVEWTLKEMILQRLITFSFDHGFFLPFRESMVETTNIGKKVINKWLWIPDYIEHTMQMSAIPTSISRKFERFGVTRSRGPASLVDGLKVSEYLPILFRTWAKFVGIIRSIEGWEATRDRVWNDRLAKGLEQDLIQFSRDPVADKLQRKIFQKVHTIVRSASENLDATGNQQIIRSLMHEYGIKIPASLMD